MSTSASILESINSELPPPISRVDRRLGRKRPPVAPTHAADPLSELRVLVRRHAMYTSEAIACVQRASDRTNRTTKEVIPCELEEGFRRDMAGDRALKPKGKLGGLAARWAAEATRLEKAMVPLLRTQPIFTEYMVDVYGLKGSAVLAAYLVSSIRFDRAVKHSNLNRYLGNACTMSGTSERRVKGGDPKFQPDGSRKDGVPGTYNDTLKPKLYLLLTSSMKNGWRYTCCEAHEAAKPPTSAKPEAKRAFRDGRATCAACLATSRPFGTTSKYLRAWADGRHSALSFDGIREINPVAPDKLAGHAMHKGRRKATDLFVWDLYVMGRALAGLPIYAEKHAVERGIRHDGSKPWDGPRSITVDEARAMVGDVGGHAATAFLFDEDLDEEADQ